jgi:hypothetical protein
MVKDRKFNEFVDNIQKVLNKSDLVDYLPIKDSDVWQATKELEQKEYFALKKSASHYYFKGLRFIREKLDENNVQVSESYLDNCYFKFIDQEKRKS